MSNRILLVDDDVQSLESTRKILELAGYQVALAGDGQAALEAFREASRQELPFHGIVTDIRMPKMGGLEFLRALQTMESETPVVLMTAYGRVEDAVWAMKMGAVDFLTKPFKKQALLTAVETALKRAAGKARPFEAGADGEPGLKASGRSLIGGSAAMTHLRAMIAQVAPTAASVLITGESGTGKELVANALHRQGPRASRPLLALNCAAVPENLIESELFGHEKNAFTGAHASKIGIFEAVNGGTLFLDEIGDMPLSLQPKLLRVLQEQEVRRVGATVSRRVDVRLVAATHRDLHEFVESGRFRQDLLFRLEVIELKIPPLRERMEDMPELVRYFLVQASERHNKAVREISPAAMHALEAYRWPGNVRELGNVIERAVVLAQDVGIELGDMPDHLIRGVIKGSGGVPIAPPSGDRTISVKVGTPLREVEDLLIQKTLEATDGDKNVTARLLGINSRTIYRWQKKTPEKGT